MELKDKKTSQGIKPSNPCPFCGCLHTEILKPGQSTSGGYQVQCVNCGARGPTGWECDQGAAQGWNNGDVGHFRPLTKRTERGAGSSIYALFAAYEISAHALCLEPTPERRLSTFSSMTHNPPPVFNSDPWIPWFSQEVFNTYAKTTLCPWCDGPARRLHGETVRYEWQCTGNGPPCVEEQISKVSRYVEGECGAKWEVAADYRQGQMGAVGPSDENFSSFYSKACANAKGGTYDGFVYFLEAVGLQRIKIGYSKDPDARLKSLQTGSPVPLVEIGRIPGDQQSETDLHQQFDHLRLDGEWFHAAKQLRDYIRGLQ